MSPITRALVFAGGLGSRLGDLGSVWPKALVPIDRDLRLVDLALQQLQGAGVTHVTFALCHRAEAIMQALGDGVERGMRFDYRVERTPLGTAGALSFLADESAPFFVANCDVVTDMELRDLGRSHRVEGNELTIAVRRHVERSPYAVLEVEDDGEVATPVVSLREKPLQVQLTNMGIYVVDPSALDVLEAGERIDMDEVVQRLLADGRAVGAHIHGGAWLDAGTPDAIEHLNERHATRREAA